MLSCKTRYVYYQSYPDSAYSRALFHGNNHYILGEAFCVTFTQRDFFLSGEFNDCYDCIDTVIYYSDALLWEDRHSFTDPKISFKRFLKTTLSSPTDSIFYLFFRNHESAWVKNLGDTIISVSGIDFPVWKFELYKPESESVPQYAATDEVLGYMYVSKCDYAVIQRESKTEINMVTVAARPYNKWRKLKEKEFIDQFMDSTYLDSISFFRRFYEDEK